MLKKREIRVFIADQHPLIREGFKSCLARQEEIDLVGEAALGQEAILEASRLEPDLVLMDLSFTDLDGLEVITQLRKSLPSVKILVFTAYTDRRHVVKLAEAGVLGYVLKTSPPEELIKAIRAVYQGEIYYSSEVSGILVNDYLVKKMHLDEENETKLSSREKEVLVHIAEGRSNKEIAGQLHISVRTVEAHREKIMSKLSIRTVAGLTKYAIVNNLIHLNSPEL